MADAQNIQADINLALLLATEAASFYARIKQSSGLSDEELTKLAGDTEAANRLALLADLAADKAEPFSANRDGVVIEGP